MAIDPTNLFEDSRAIDRRYVAEFVNFGHCAVCRMLMWNRAAETGRGVVGVLLAIIV